MDWIFIWQWITVDAFRKKKKKLDDIGGGEDDDKKRSSRPPLLRDVYIWRGIRNRTSRFFLVFQFEIDKTRTNDRISCQINEIVLDSFYYLTLTFNFFLFK
jgi:hypothetical protein